MSTRSSCAQALEARPETQRTRAAYERVLDAYRAVYHHDPASPKADASVLAIAQLLTEEGRIFSDEKLLHDAIGQYEFLRVQYPERPLPLMPRQIVEGEKQARVDAERDPPHAPSPAAFSVARTSITLFWPLPLIRSNPPRPVP